MAVAPASTAFSKSSFTCFAAGSLNIFNDK
jgi:hypothetical protein